MKKFSTHNPDKKKNLSEIFSRNVFVGNIMQYFSPVIVVRNEELVYFAANVIFHYTIEKSVTSPTYKLPISCAMYVPTFYISTQIFHI